MTAITQRLEQLRELMRREHLGAFIFPSTDAHQSEYVADHWKGREWISGFDGSAGTAVVTLTSAALWTDSRYFLAAEEQLRGTEFQLMKLKIVGTPTIAELLGTQFATGNLQSTEVGIDGMVSSTEMVEELIKDLRQQGGLTVRTNLDPLKTIWRNRPVIPDHPVEIQPLELAGETVASKIARIRQALHTERANTAAAVTAGRFLVSGLGTALDERAAFNAYSVFVSIIICGICENCTAVARITLTIGVCGHTSCKDDAGVILICAAVNEKVFRAFIADCAAVLSL